MNANAKESVLAISVSEIRNSKKPPDRKIIGSATMFGAASFFQIPAM